MKSNFKNINQMLEEYIALLDEQIEIPLLIEKVNEKYKEHLSQHTTAVYKPKESNELFKFFTQIKKYQEREIELKTEIEQTESLLKEFLYFVKGGKVSYEKKDDNVKSKITFLFWIENDKIVSNR